MSARLRVVLVDDSAEVRALVCRRLEASGTFEVVAEGADGDEAIALAYRHTPELLLLDTSMPRVDGIEALPAIRELCPDTAVVMFTGFEDAALEDRARELGAADFIQKSIPLGLLPQRLARLLGVGSVQAPGRDRLRLMGPQDAAEAGEQDLLDQHSESFRDLFDRAAIGMATMTSAGRIVRANAALADLMSCEPDELLGVDYGRLTGGRGDELDQGLAAIETHGEDLATFEHPAPSGTPQLGSGTLRVTLAPIRDLHGHVLYVFAQVQDITAQREAEEGLRRTRENFRLLLGAVREYAIFMLDVDGTVVSWNSGAERIKGYSAEEIVGRSFTLFYLPEDRERGHPERNLRVALASGQLAEEGWRVRKDDTRFWASVVISPMYDDRGRHIGFAKVTRDQTDRRAYERERQDLLAQQSEVLALTAHELRSPLAVIDGSAAELTGTWAQLGEPERTGLLDAIGGSTHRLHRLAADLATASQQRAESLDLQRADVPLGDLLRHAAKRFAAIHPESELVVHDPQVVDVRVDAVRVGQALDNLLDNTWRHGGAPVEVDTEVGPHSVRITVTDAGTGVSSAVAPRLFEKYASSRRGITSGLGLYLVREVARLHGGEAYYQPPESGRGPTFVISLPREA